MSNSCPFQRDANIPCFYSEGEPAVETLETGDRVCSGCRRNVVETSEPTQPEKETHRVGLKLSINGTHDEVILDGVDITRLCNRIDVSARPDQLLAVQLGVLLNRINAVEIPEALMHVSVIDDARAINLEMALVDLLTTIQQYIATTDPEEVSPELQSAASTAAKVVMTETDVTPTVRERLRHLIW